MQFARYQRDFSDIPGFVIPESMAIWDFFLSKQREDGKTGSLMEIGVYRGKSALMLAMHARPEELLFLIDPSRFVDEAEITLRRVKSENLQIIRAKSSASVSWRSAQNRCCRWIHIDGDHKAKTVDNDLRLASKLLADDGIICVDDFFSPRYPSLTYAVCQFLEHHGPEFQMFLCGFNKAYLTRRRNHRYSLRLVREDLGTWLTNCGFSDFTIYKTDIPGAMNSFGIANRWENFTYYGLDEDPSKIVY